VRPVTTRPSRPVVALPTGEYDAQGRPHQGNDRAGSFGRIT
jgi:hypothetical protein